MTHTYSVTGMTCNNCVNSVKAVLSGFKEIQSADVTLDPPRAVVTMKQHVPLEILNKKLAEKGKYELKEETSSHEKTNEQKTELKQSEEKSSFFSTYKPVLLVFFYLIGITLTSQLVKGSFHLMEAMHLFMGGFFLVFSFFKMLDLKGFAYSYMSYDIVAQKWMGWGYIYPFIELILGTAFITHFMIFEATVATALVMGVSSIGVIKSLAAKKKFQCACLGTVFNLPMSNITLIEDLLMVVMAVVMLVM